MNIENPVKIQENECREIKSLAMFGYDIDDTILSEVSNFINHAQI